MEAFEESYHEASSYPCNLVDSDVPALLLHATRQELHQQAHRLFCDESSASIDFLEVQCERNEPSLRCVRNRDDLRKVLGSAIVQQRRDPTCRMIFIYAPTSRDRLNITLPMMQDIFSYHQVMPSYLESLFSFGFREHSDDCLVTSFISHNCLPGEASSLRAPQLGRSGEFTEHCYGLRGVERSNATIDWPWSIRLCLTYHSLDLTSSQATWIVTKANRLIEKLTRDAMALPDCRNSMGRGTVGNALATALTIHELLAVWAGSNWQLYINFLEGVFQECTRPALSLTLDKTSTTVPARQTTQFCSVESSSPLSYTAHSLDEKTTVLRRTVSSLQDVTHRVRSITNRHLRPSAPARNPKTMAVSTHQFYFRDIPRVHYIEEKANETLDIISNNIEVLEALKLDYSTTIETCGNRIVGTEVCEAYNHFVKVVNRVEKNLQTQQTRLKQLLRLLGDRKVLVQGILNFESMEANRLLAEKATLSAQNMENIAVKTKLETVSMRIITLVTLFFLPGTFISTLMSTPIVTFAPGSPSTSDSNISTGALGFYCAVSLPLVVFTFAAWGLVYWWETRTEKKRQRKAQLLSNSEPP